MLSTLILTLATVSAMADIGPKPRPRIEPGPVQALKEDSVLAMDALTSAKATDMKKFMSAGNRITSATVQNLAPSKVMYTFTRQSCTMGGFAGNQCIGGAQLQVTVETVRDGEMVQRIVKSSVISIRAM